MTPWRMFVATAAVVLSGTIASAASLAMTSASLGAGSAGVEACDSTFTLDYATQGGLVTEVTVGDLVDPACEEGSLSLALMGGGTRVGAGGPKTVPTDADTSPNEVVVAIADQPQAADVDAFRVAITGP